MREVRGVPLKLWHLMIGQVAVALVRAALTQLPLTKLWPIVALNMCCIITGCVAATTYASRRVATFRLLAASTNLITAYRLDFDFDFCATTETAASVVIQALRPLLNVLQTWPR